MTNEPNDDLSNASRVERFQACLETYNDEHDTRANLTDLLADARHWCDANGQSFADIDRLAYQHYACERASETEANS